MKDFDLSDPKLAPAKRKTLQVAKRTVKDLFADVDESVTFKDKRGRPWLKHPRQYAKAQISVLKAKKSTPSNELSSSDDEDDDDDEDKSDDETASSSGDATSSSDSEYSEKDPFQTVAELKGTVIECINPY